jgi:hypothetical protein
MDLREELNKPIYCVLDEQTLLIAIAKGQEASRG